MAFMLRFSRSFSTRGSFRIHEWVANVNKLNDISRDPVKSRNVPFVPIRRQKLFLLRRLLDTFRGFAFAGVFSTEYWLLQGALSAASLLLNKPPSKSWLDQPRILSHNLMTDGLTLEIYVGQLGKENVSVFVKKSTLLVTIVMLGGKLEANILHYHILLPFHMYRRSM